MTFYDLRIGEWFEFADKTPIGRGMYNGPFRKVAVNAYRGPCFNARPSPTAEVLRVKPSCDISPNGSVGDVRESPASTEPSSLFYESPEAKQREAKWREKQARIQAESHVGIEDEDSLSLRELSYDQWQIDGGEDQ